MSSLGLGGTQLLLLASALVVSQFSLNFKFKMRIERAVFSGVIALIFSGISCQVLKHIIGRPRPRIGDMCGIVGPTFISGFDSFPSGHTTTSFAIAAVISYYLPKIRWPIFIFAAIIAASRIGLGSHYPSDVGGGIILGLFIGSLVIKQNKKYEPADYGYDNLNLKTHNNQLTYHVYYKDKEFFEILKHLVDIYKNIPENWRSKKNNESDLTIKSRYPDYSFHQTKWATVIRMPHSDSALYLKVFHYTGIKQISPVILYPSKAFNFFYSAKHLFEAGIAGPNVVALGEAKNRVLLKKSFVLYKELSGIPIHKLTHISSRSMVTAVALALSNIHSQGIYHCDLRPANILWDDGEVGFIDIEKLRTGKKNNFSLIARDLGKLYDPKLPISNFTRLRFFVVYLRGNPALLKKRKNILKRTGKYSEKVYKQNPIRVKKSMLTILHTEASTGWGGQEIRIVQESLGMIRRGYKVIIAAPERSNIFKRAKEQGITVYPAEFQKKNPLSYLKLRSIMNRLMPDIVNTHSSSDSWVASMTSKLSSAKPRIIRTRHLSTPISKSYLSRLIYDILMDAVITTGEEIRQRMINDNRFDAAKIVSIPTGVDVNLFDPEKVNPVIQKAGFKVGMVGVLRSWKGHKYFIESAPEILKQIPDAVFYIAGDGPQRENIINLIRELSLGSKINLLGHREDIPEILASLDVIVHPSYANEGVPQSLLQALAMEKAVVASDAGAIKEIIIDTETGFLVEPKKTRLIADRVIHLYKNPELRKELGKKGRKLVEEYSREKMFEKIERLYEKLLRDK